MKRELNLAERMVLETEGVAGLRERGIVQSQVVYVVVEDDRGCGPTVLGVYTNVHDAVRLVEQHRYAFISQQVLVNN